MPLFEYRCEACAHLEEVLQKHSDPPPEACPSCGKPGTMVKAISLTSFQLKGGGWYKDLYASSSTSKGEGGSSSSASNASSTTSPSGSSGTSSASASSDSSKSKPPETKAAAQATTPTASS